MRRIFFIFILSAISLAISAQNQYLDSPRYGQGDAKFVETQGWQIMNLVHNTLEKYPPVPVDRSLDPQAKRADKLIETPRRQTLYLLDAMLHDPRYNNSECVKNFLEQRLSSLIPQMDVPVEKGLKIFHIYDMGFVVKSPSLTAAFDVSSQDGKIFSTEVLKEIADRCDILFITHRHADHLDNTLINYMLEQGKKVVVTKDACQGDERVEHLRPKEGNDISGKIDLEDGRTVKYRIFPGHQDESSATWIECNHYFITFPEGGKVLHLGDQAHSSDIDWMKKYGNRAKGADVMFATGWMGQVGDILECYKPKYVILGHFNELTHSIDRKIPFWYGYYNWANVGYPVVIPCWGETYEIKK